MLRKCATETVGGASPINPRYIPMNRDKPRAGSDKSESSPIASGQAERDRRDPKRLASPSTVFLHRNCTPFLHEPQDLLIFWSMG